MEGNICCGCCVCIVSFFNFILRLIFQIIEFYFVIILTNIIIETNLILISTTIYDKYYSFLSIPANSIFQYLSLNVLTIYYFELFQFSYIYKQKLKDILLPELLSQLNENIEMEKKLINKNIYDQKENIVPNNMKNENINNKPNRENDNKEIKTEIINNNTFNIINDKMINLNENIINYNSSFIINIENESQGEKEPERESELEIFFGFLFILVIYYLMLIRIFDYFYIIFLFLVGVPFQKLMDILLFIALPSKYIKSRFNSYFNSIAYALRAKGQKNYKLKRKIKLFIIAFCLEFYIVIFGKNNFEGFLFFFLLYYFLCCFSQIQIEPWIFHKIYKNCFSKKRSNLNRSIYYKLSKKYKSFKIFNIAFSIVYIIIDLFLLYFLIKIHIIPNKSLNNVQTHINKTGLFSGKHWEVNPYPSSYNVSSTLCYTKTHYLNFIQLAALANAAYFEDEKNTEENILKAFKPSIFNITGGKFEIKNMSFLTNASDHVTVLQADFNMSTKKPLTVLSIKGTSNAFDFWLDAEMFLSSLIFSTLRNIPLFTFENFLSHEFNKFATLPFRYLENITLSKRYIGNIENIFTKLQNKTGYGLKDRSYLFVGHSLGGGLAKYIAFKYRLQGVSFSGPGLTPLEINLIHKNININKTYEKYFQSTFIDIVPDYDPIPRVELSGGSIYRVVCEKGLFECHAIIRTLCMMGVMCNQEYLTGDICKGVYSDEEYKKDFINVFRNQYYANNNNK